MALRRLRLDDAALPLHGTQATRRIEHAATALLPEYALMSEAGLSAARLAVALKPHAQRIRVHVGPGNNGGDGLVAAMHLHQWGRRVEVVLAQPLTAQPPDAARALREAREAGVPIGTGEPEGPADLDIDALLGIGASRPLDGPLALASVRLQPFASTVLALDLPSGLAADTGIADPRAVRARWTLSLLTLKPGLFTGQGRDHAGEVWWDDLGVPPQASDVAGPLAALPGRGHLLRPARPHATHKGRFGDVCVIGGAAGMAGAAWLAGHAALLAGAGRVHVCVLGDDPRSAGPVDLGLMTLPASEATDASVLSDATVAAGCGGGDAIGPTLAPIIHHAARLVLDADALNAVAASPALRGALLGRAQQGQATVLTPHPLEAARLLGTVAAAVQADRLAAARTLATAFRCTVVLKGSGTVVASGTAGPWINPTGNAALATAGTGDVLAGWIAGCWASDGADPELAALRAVHAHGLAADDHARTGAQGPLTATTLLQALRQAPRARR